MAIISRIRNNSWIIVVLIGLGMGGFLLMDALQSPGSIFTGKNTLGSVNGKSISPQEFSERTADMAEMQKGAEPLQVRAGAWDYFVSASLIEQTAAAMGVGMSKTEMDDQIVGQNPSYAIRQRIQSQQEMQQLQQLYKQPQSQWSNEFKKFINKIQEEVRVQTLGQKVLSVAQKAIYTPNWMAQAELQRSVTVDFRFVPLPFATINDKDVKVEDNDLTAYIRANAARYKRDEETRSIGYTVLSVVPTDKDSALVRNEILALKEGLTKASNDSAFFVMNYGNYTGEFQKKDAVKDTVAKLSVGSIVGPYADGGYYRVAKLIARATLPDSAKSRHILIKATQGDKVAEAKAKAKADSVVLVIKGGMPFDTAARKFSDDQGSAAVGGSLGTVAFDVNFVKPFKDAIFQKAPLGELYVVQSQFGYHIVQVQERKGSSERLKVGFFNKPIVPTKATESAAQNRANELLQKSKTFADLEKNVKADGKLQFRTADDVKLNDFQLVGLEASDATARIAGWAFKHNPGDVCPEVFQYINRENKYTDRCVIFGVSRIDPKGLATIADPRVKEEVTYKVRNAKKAEKILEKIKGKEKDLDAVAAAFQSEVKTVTGATLNTPGVEGLGNEPKVVGTALGTEVNKTAKPVIGEGGVFIVQTTQKGTAPAAADLTAVKRQLEAKMMQGISQMTLQSLKQRATISDYRAAFFNR